jgi:hypothetical protein
MHEPFDTSTSDGQPECFRATFTSFPTHIRQLEAERAYFCAWLRAHRFRASLRAVGRLWPIGVGIALGLVAPQLCALVSRFEPWGLWLVFPFAVLALRPELHAAQQLGNLPHMILYAQFPLEGLIVRTILGRRVTILGVAGQVLYFHYLAGLQLLLIGGAVTQALVR